MVSGMRSKLGSGDVRTLLGSIGQALDTVRAEGLNADVAGRIGEQLGATGGRVTGGIGAGAGAAVATAGASPLVQVPAAWIAKDAGAALGGNVGGNLGKHLGTALYKIDAALLQTVGIIGKDAR